MDGRVCEVSMTERAGGTRCCRFHPSLRRIASRGANTCASSLVHVSILTRAFEWSDLGRVKATTTHRSAPLGVLFGHAHLCFGTWQGSLPLYLLLKRCQYFLFSPSCIVCGSASGDYPWSSPASSHSRDLPRFFFFPSDARKQKTRWVCWVVSCPAVSLFQCCPRDYEGSFSTRKRTEPEEHVLYRT